MSRTIFAEIFEKFAIKRPVALLGKMTVHAIFSNEAIDQIFEENSKSQYTKQLAFSTCARLLGEVALFGTSSINAACKKFDSSIPVSISAVYQKLRNVEPAVCQALVETPAAKAALLIHQLNAARNEPIPGYRLRVIDGNYLARSERRIKELRDSNVASIPGMSMAVYDYATDLISALRVDEDGHANERKLTPALAEIAQQGDLFLADRLYLTYNVIDTLCQRGSKYLIRHHASIPLHLTGREVKGCGRCKTGKVSYQGVELKDGRCMTAIIVTRDKPTKEGKSKVVLLTNLEVTKELALQLADLYLKRWKIEESFRQLTQYLSCEIRALGYPRASLLAFSLAVTAYNCLRCVKAAISNRFGTSEVDENLSMFYVGEELKQTIAGLEVVLDSDYWQSYETIPIPELAASMKQVAKHINFERYRKSKRGPKKKKLPVKRKSHVHSATADILAKRKTKKRLAK
jgi:hypothetical protein